MQGPPARRQLAKGKRLPMRLSLAPPLGQKLPAAVPCPTADSPGVAPRPTGSGAAGASAVLPWLWLGAEEDAQDGETLASRGITYLLNAARECGPGVSAGAADGSADTGLRYLQLELADDPDAPVEPLLGPAAAFIARAHGAGAKVLVYCRRGVSRSATVVIAYLMLHMGMSLDAASQLVALARPCIQPNLGFELALIALQSRLRQGDSGCRAPRCSPPVPPPGTLPPEFPSSPLPPADAPCCTIASAGCPRGQSTALALLCAVARGTLRSSSTECGPVPARAHPARPTPALLAFASCAQEALSSSSSERSPSACVQPATGPAVRRLAHA
eukprot:TRINITY_DN61420_c0_g1_i1.p1 TRINITY_DN61420_c0_g1~~TRINITY_DN61420_c0_g1_i1.p1  ORF type:complete len:330 (+),score=81.27 TRINITY_DN61420_c0_g1_i1:69-1058(+)